MRSIVLASLLVLGIAAPAAADEKWSGLQAEYRRLFVPLPVKRMFSTDLERELKISRRDPYTPKAREEIAKARDRIKLRRAQIVGRRAKREELLEGLIATGHAGTGATLVKAFDRVLGDMDLAQKVLDRHREALERDINPGVDPGGVYWERWAGDERAAAQAVLTSESKLLDFILTALNAVPDASVRAWVRRQAAAHPRRDVRQRVIAALAQGSDPGAAIALRTVLAGEREAWARTHIVSALGHGKPDGAKAVLLGALSDEAWPVRAAAVEALRRLDARDATVVAALIAALEAETGRLRLEIRDALVWATDVKFGPVAATWRDWWAKDGGPDWPPLPRPAKVTPAAGADVSRCFAVPTTSLRIAFVVNGGSGMRTPATRRATGNDGKPSPEPRVDTSYRIAVWELEEALASLPEDAEFTVILCGREVSVWARKLKKATKANRSKAVRFVRRHTPDGAAAIARGLEAALRLGQPKGLDDLRYGTEAGVDTVFIVGGSNPVRRDERPRMRSIRVVSVNIGRLAGG